MEFSKQQVVDLVKDQMGGDQAAQAAQQLPDQIDHEQDGELLQEFGVNPQELMDRFGGGAGGGGQAGGGEASSGAA